MTKGPNSDIQAVIFCGPGHGLDAIIDEETLPKCLLPVGNKPMLYHPITWLQQSGISDIILVAHQSLYSKLTQLIKLHINDGGNYIDIVCLDQIGAGTVEAFRAVRPRLHSDFILLSCDLITESPLYPLIDQHRTNNALVTVMLAAAQKAAAGGKTDDASRHNDLEDYELYAGTDESRKKLLYLVGKADIEDTLDFRMSLLNKFHCILLRTNLSDAHCYIFRKEFLEMFDSGEATGKRNMFSIREELIPRLVKHQKLDGTCKEKSSFSSAAARPSNTCAVKIVDGEFCVRVNNLKTFTEANRFVCKSIPLGVNRVSASAEVNAKAQVGSDSLVGDYTKIGEKSSVKRSIIGNNVSIGKNVKISNCIIMDKVNIEDK